MGEVLEDISMASGSLLLIIHAAMLAGQCVQSSSLASCVNQARQFARTVRACVRPSTGAAPDEFEECVHGLLDRKRIVVARAVHIFGTWVTTAVVVRHVVMAALRIPTWTTPVQFLAIVMMQALFLLLKATRALAPRHLDVSFALFMLLQTVYVAGGSVDYMFRTSGITLILSLGYCCSHLRVASAAFWGLVIMCTSCFRHSQTGGGRAARQSMYLFEVCGTLIILAAVHVLRQHLLAVARREIQFRRLESAYSAAISLLDLTCDVVVDLKSDMTFACDSRPMSALLMRDSGASVAGRPFCDFISGDAERRRFREQLSVPRAESEASVGTCCVQLSDSLQNPVNAELFFVRLRVLGENCRYMVGIREYSDEILTMPSFGQPPGLSRKTGGRQPRRRPEPELKGTPPVSTYVSLVATSLAASWSASQAASQAASQPKRLRHPELVEIQRASQHLGLVVCMSGWNVQVPRSACCAFHAYVNEVRAVLRDDFTRWPCAYDFPAVNPAGVQCQECGQLETEMADMCTMCDSRELRQIGERCGGSRASGESTNARIKVQL